MYDVPQILCETGGGGGDRQTGRQTPSVKAYYLFFVPALLCIFQHFSMLTQALVSARSSGIHEHFVCKNSKQTEGT